MITFDTNLTKQILALRKEVLFDKLNFFEKKTYQKIKQPKAKQWNKKDTRFFLRYAPKHH